MPHFPTRGIICGLKKATLNVPKPVSDYLFGFLQLDADNLIRFNKIAFVNYNLGKMEKREVCLNGDVTSSQFILGTFCFYLIEM